VFCHLFGNGVFVVGFIISTGVFQKFGTEGWMGHGIAVNVIHAVRG